MAIERTSTWSPDFIVSTLFSFHNKAHYYHLQTQEFGRHKFLDTLYKELVESKDSIAEYLLGVQAPKRLGPITMSQIEPYSEQNLQRFLDEGIEFAKGLCKYAEFNSFNGLLDYGSKLEQLFVSARLFNTYK
jgi:hypothetical protein